LAIGDGVTVDLLEDGGGIRLLVGALGRVVPGEVLDGLVAGVGAAGVESLEPDPKVIHEPQVGAAVARRLDDLVVPLDEPLGVGEGALLLTRQRGGQEEYLTLAVVVAE